MLLIEKKEFFWLINLNEMLINLNLILAYFRAFCCIVGALWIDCPLMQSDGLKTAENGIIGNYSVLV